MTITSRFTRPLAVGLAALLCAGACVGQPPPDASAGPGVGARDTLRLAYWTRPSTINNHFGRGATDNDAASLVLEPLARIGADGTLVAALASEIPTVANGGVSADGRTVTWKLRTDVKWSDGTPFTAADVAFTYALIADPAARATTRGLTTGVNEVREVDTHTVRVVYDRPSVGAAGLFVGPFGHILQKRQYTACTGAAAGACPHDRAPTGTGPFKVSAFSEDEIRYEANPHYRVSGRPYFGAVSLRAALDPLTTAQMVLLTGEADYAWNIQLDGAALASVRDAPATKGRVLSATGPEVERILLNHTDPDPARGDERSEPGRPHPILSDVRVRTALALALDRRPIAALRANTELVCSLVTGVPRPAAADTSACRHDPAAAAKLLDDAGWRPGSGGLRSRAGRELRLTLVATVNPDRQKVQELVKDAWTRVGVAVDLKAVPHVDFLGRESPDSAGRFYADAQLISISRTFPDAADVLGDWTCAEIRTKAHGWTGGNIGRWCDPAFDRLHAELVVTRDAPGRAERILALDQLLVRDVAAIPLYARKSPFSAAGADIEGPVPTPWDSELWNVAEWRRRR